MSRAGETDRAMVLADEQETTLCRLGRRFVTATPAQLDALRAAVAPVYATIERGAGNRAALTAIRVLKRRYPPDVVRCPTRDRLDAPRRSTSGRLVGQWRATITEKQLRRSPLLSDGAEMNNENWGDLAIWFFRDGRFRITQRNAHAESEIVGTYSVKGDTITFEARNLGETFVLRWSTFRDKLRFTRDEKLGVGPVFYLISAFRKVG
jgi:hypothetical protein